MIDFPSRARGVLEFMAVRHMHDMPNALVYSNDHWSIYQFGPDPQIWKPATLTGLIKHRILVELDPIKGRPILALSTKGVELILNGSVAHDVRAESTVHFRIVSYSAPSSPGTETT
jgi:hypothetical protein